ncbi:3-ketoacyl-CoA synthase 7 [Amborella trichopoda]|uniref:3-ketoacyl-CoA synthase n=1 Tax=Amborella trichopoda TaxID=13333 RepID=W1NMK7_AMBTC|nr:3-ketoacyl-CoA synthase 7 [Amborella trichopoda]ERM97122.1 hypothetical protein AMTR_s00126p00068780 [Amborella trichopoda]|eukprot:XP_006829706.1 3-ketoacyl-CoA synthase 7 [Amborella trichopoda]
MNPSHLARSLVPNSVPQITYAYYLVAACLLALAVYALWGRKQVYLIDFCCYRPPDMYRIPMSTFMEHTVLNEAWDSASIEFQEKVLERSGLGYETCMPPTISHLPADHSVTGGLEELKMVAFPIIEEVLTSNRVSPKCIDILVTNCSLYCHTPSFSAMVVNRFGMRSNVKTFSLAGMGCSAGLLSISLARDLLGVHTNSLALVVSMEILSSNGYTGKEKSMLVTNCLFRMGGAAILLSNRRQNRPSAKYKLQHLVRTHMGADDRAYHCVFQDTDTEGAVGVALSRGLPHVAANALRTNIATLGPLVLPLTEQARYALSAARKALWAAKSQLYIPNFGSAFQHFCIHAGGRAVIDAIEENLKLSKEQVEASKMTLFRFGNTSSSSIWYELCYLEAKGKVKRGDKIWQIAFGSGFKCNSAVWKCISDLEGRPENAWSDRIDRYPVDVPQVIEH